MYPVNRKVNYMSKSKTVLRAELKVKKLSRKIMYNTLLELPTDVLRQKMNAANATLLKRKERAARYREWRMTPPTLNE